MATRPPEVGLRISAVKRGVPQVTLEADELTLTKAWHEWKAKAVGRKALQEGAVAGRLPHRLVPRPGRQPDSIVFDRTVLGGALQRCPCSFPGCENPAPGDSGRCGRHAARVKYETVGLVCRHCGDTFTRPGSWLQGLEGRGHYCSDRCKGLAVNPERLRGLNPDGAREYHTRIAAHVEAEGLLDTARAAQRRHYSPAGIRAAVHRGELRRTVRRFGRTVRSVYETADIDGYMPGPKGVPRGGNLIACPACGRKRYRAPSHEKHARCFECRLHDFRDRRHLARAQAARTLRGQGVPLDVLLPVQREGLLAPLVGVALNGRPRARYHGAWAAQFKEARTWWDERAELGLLDERPPTNLRLCLDIALDDYSIAADRWSYNPSAYADRASRRVWQAVRRAAS